MTRQTSPSTVRTRSRLITLIACGVAAVALAGCKAHNHGITSSIPLTSAEDRNPILQPGEFSVLDIPVVKGEGRLSAKEKVDVEVFLNSYRENGAGPLFIASPQGTKNERAAVRRVGEIRHIARRVGVSEDAIVVEPYTPYAGEFGFPVSLRYQAHSFVVPQCGHIDQDLAANPSNLPYDNFGCFQQRNLATMVANRNDLRHPRQEGPRYANARNRVLESYGKGELTPSANNETTGENLSEVGE